VRGPTSAKIGAITARKPSPGVVACIGQAKAKRDPFKRLPMPCRDADSGMDQLMREDGRDLCRHRVGRVGEGRNG
jgi:hypothetical protein